VLSPNLPWSLANPKWAAELNPVLANPIVSGQLLTGIKLTNGSNTINHNLGQPLQGYIVVLNSSPATFYDKQNTNPAPQRTLILNASQETTVSLWVF
jgi:hypothetical protein